MVVNLDDVDCVLAKEAFSRFSPKDVDLYVLTILLLLVLLHLIVEYPHKFPLVLFLAELDVAVAMLVHQLNNILVVL
jgi:hypothetical protein